MVNHHDLDRAASTDKVDRLICRISRLSPEDCARLGRALDAIIELDRPDLEDTRRRELLAFIDQARAGA